MMKCFKMTEMFFPSFFYRIFQIFNTGEIACIKKSFTQLLYIGDILMCKFQHSTQWDPEKSRNQ